MTKKLAPHLIGNGGNRLCSACSQSFVALSGPTLSLAFRKHVETVHSEAQQREAASLVAALEFRADEWARSRVRKAVIVSARIAGRYVFNPISR
jgi:hypothetical protein